MADLSGQFIGRYRILEQLGLGGMAMVYKALDPRLEREVAIKLILPGRDHTDNFLKRFDLEAHALAHLSHPNIVKVLDYGEHEGTPYLVMEYIPGGNLMQRMGRQIPFQQAARLLAPVARALAYAHSQKIIHRDVKPANILLTQSGEPMLSDFGIAKMLNQEATAELTRTGFALGTLEYMAPEQALGQSVDYRADIYSLGVVFYELITGRKPYHADTPMAVLHKQLTEPLKRPSAFVPGLPDGVEQVVLRALAREPDQRFTSMAEFGAVLEALGQGQTFTGSTQLVDGSQATIQAFLPGKSPVVPAKPAEAISTRVTPKPSRSWVWIGGIGVGLLGIFVVSVTVFGILYFQSKNKPTPTTPPVAAVAEIPTRTEIPNPSGMETTIPSLTPATQSTPTLPPVATSNAPTLLAYVRGSTFENQNADVYVANTDGSGAACLACNQCSESEPSISPDGQSVVYQSTCNGHPDLFVVSASGSEGYYLTNTDSLSEREPAFSPDGKQIIYRVSANNVDRNNNGELYVMDSDGSNAHSLNIQGRGPTWSPDGLKLAYMSNENGPWQIYIYTLTTKNSQKITNCTVNCRWPAWSPNGMYIAYNTTPSASSMEPDSIWYVRSDGSGAATLVVQADRGAGRPSWSASGWIAFNTVNGIEEIRQDGSQRKILINETDAWAPAWSK